jgi:hypothetical protein
MSFYKIYTSPLCEKLDQVIINVIYSVMTPSDLEQHRFSVYITAMNNRGATLGEIKHPLGFRKEP